MREFSRNDALEQCSRRKLGAVCARSPRGTERWRIEEAYHELAVLGVVVDGHHGVRPVILRHWRHIGPHRIEGRHGAYLGFP